MMKKKVPQEEVNPHHCHKMDLLKMMSPLPWGGLQRSTTSLRATLCHITGWWEWLEAYFSHWDGAVEYSCIEYTHPLENTYWKSKVLIFTKDVEKDAYLKDRGYRHDGHRATMEESMEEAAFTACLFLREYRFGNMRWDIHRYLPRIDPEQGWGMLEPADLDPVSRVMVYFAHEMVEKHMKLQDMVIAQGKALKWCNKMIDDHREREGQPKIYGKHDYEPRP